MILKNAGTNCSDFGDAWIWTKCIFYYKTEHLESEKRCHVEHKMFLKYSCFEGLVPSAMARGRAFETWLDLEVLIKSID